MPHELLNGLLLDMNAEFQSFPTNPLSHQSQFSFAITLINAIVSTATLGLYEVAFDLRFQYRHLAECAGIPAAVKWADASPYRALVFRLACRTLMRP